MLTCSQCRASYEPASYRDNYFCPGCEAITVVSRDLDHFSALGFEAPACDKGELKARYRELNRLLHPDRYGTASEAQRQASLINVAKVNDAYRCLEDTVARARYWLDLRGKPLGSEGDGLAPPLAAQLFEFQELAANITAQPNDSAVRSSTAEAIGELQTRIDGAVGNVERMLSNWSLTDDAEALTLLATDLAEIAYLKTAVRNLKTALEAGCRRSVA